MSNKPPAFFRKWNTPRVTHRRFNRSGRLHTLSAPYKEEFVITVASRRVSKLGALRGRRRLSADRMRADRGRKGAEEAAAWAFFETDAVKPRVTRKVFLPVWRNWHLKSIAFVKEVSFRHRDRGHSFGAWDFAQKWGLMIKSSLNGHLGWTLSKWRPFS